MKTLGEQAAAKILRDISERKGIGDELDLVESSVRDEIKASFAQIIDTLHAQQPTPTVAKIAEEVAKDLGDYIVIAKYGEYQSYRRADAQEMIERAFAGLEPKPVSADVEQIAQLAWEAIEHGLTYEGVTAGKTIITQAITAALAQLQAELEQANANYNRVCDLDFQFERQDYLNLQNELEAVNQAAENMARHADADIKELRSRLVKLQAELEQAQAKYLSAQETTQKYFDLYADSESRLATAEAVRQAENADRNALRCDKMCGRIATQRKETFLFCDECAPKGAEAI